jgi:hypothetical protein
MLLNHLELLVEAFEQLKLSKPCQRKTNLKLLPCILQQALSGSLLSLHFEILL